MLTKYNFTNRPVLVICPSKCPILSFSPSFLQNLPHSNLIAAFLHVFWLVVAGYSYQDYSYQEKQHLGQNSSADRGVSFCCEGGDVHTPNST